MCWAEQEKEFLPHDIFKRGYDPLGVIDWEVGVTPEMGTPGGLLGAVEPLSHPTPLRCEAALDPPSAPVSCAVWKVAFSPLAPRPGTSWPLDDGMSDMSLCRVAVGGRILPPSPRCALSHTSDLHEIPEGCPELPDLPVSQRKPEIVLRHSVCEFDILGMTS